MSKIQPMGVGAYDTQIAVTKRVFWRPVSTGTPLKVGDPVCYCKDFQDHKERTSPPHSGHLGGSAATSYAEGSQTATGRLFIVEEPLVDNIDQFAGIVKSLGPEAGGDGDFIEIWVANSGAVVPANVVLTTTTAGRTIVAVMVGTRTLGSPTQDNPDWLTYSDGGTDWSPGSIDSKVVGIAMESLSAAGLCWVKLDENMFQHQGGQNVQEFRVEAVDDDVTVNKMNIRFGVTSGHCQMLHYRAVLAGTGGDGQRGVYRFETVMAGANKSGQNVLGLLTHLELGADSVGGGILAPLQVGLRTKNVNPNLSASSYLCAISIDWILRKTDTGALDNPTPYRPIFYINTDGSGTQPNYLFWVDRKEILGAHNAEGNLTSTTSGDKMIPVSIDNNVYYLVAYADDDVA